MAKRINRSEFDIPDGLKEFREGVALTKTAMKGLKTDLSEVENYIKNIVKDAAKIKTAVGNVKTANLADIRRQNELLKEAVKLQAEKEKLDRIKAMTELQLVKLENEKLKVAERARKAAEREAKQMADNDRPYAQASKRLNQLRKDYKDLAIAGMENTKAGKEMLAQIQKLDSTLKTIDATVGQHQRKVGDYDGALSKLKLTFSSVIGLASQFGIALGGVAIARDALKTLKEFDEAAADMAKTLNIGVDEARELSREFLKFDTRTGIDELQKIAAIGGQLGIAADQIVGFTEATDKLNVALGDEFSGGAEEITSVIGGLRNIFSDIKSDKIDQDLLHIGNALNVLGAEGAATAPVISDFAGRIGGVGIPLGLTTGQVLGLSSTLQELNVSAERGGTAVTKILQKLGTNAPEFAKFARNVDGSKISLTEFKNLVNTDIFEAFKRVVNGAKEFKGNAVGLSNALAKLKLSGSANSEVFLKLAGNMELLDTRTGQANDSLKETDSILDEFGKKNNTLGANIEKLSNAWDEYVISVDSATNASGAFSNLLGVIANNLPTIINLVLKLVASYVTYRAVLISLNLIQKISKEGLKNYVSELFKAKEGADGAAKSAAGLGNALKSIGFTAVIALAAQLAQELYDIASGARQAQIDIGRMDKAGAEGAETANARVSEAQKKRDQAILDAQDLKNKGKITEIELINRTKKANEEYEKSVQNMAEVTSEKQKENFKQYENAVKAMEDYRKDVGDIKFETLRTLGAALREGGVSGAAAAGVSNPGLNQQAIALDVLIQRVSVLKANQENLSTRNEIYNQELFNLNKASIEAAAGTDKLGAAYDNSKEKIEDYTMRVRELRDLQISNDQEREEAQLKTKLDSDLAAIKANGIKAYEYRISLENKYEDDLLALRKQYVLKRIEAEYEYWDAVKEAQNQAKSEYEADQNEAYQQEIDAIENRDKQLELKLLKGTKNKQYTDKEIEKEKQGRQIESLEQQIATAEYYGKETIDLELQLAKLKRDIRDKEIEEEKARQKELRQLISDGIKAVLDQAKKASEEREKLLDQQIDASRKTEDELREAARQGTDTAEESLAAQKEITQKRLDEKDREAQIQADIEKLKIAYDLFSKFIENGDSIQSASAKTSVGIKAIENLVAGLKSLKKYFNGTDDTGTVGGMSDQYGKITGVTHENEMVFSAEQKKAMGDKKRSEIIDIVQKNDRGLAKTTIHKREFNESLNWRNSQKQESMQPLLNKVDELTKVIQSRPTEVFTEEWVEGLGWLLAHVRKTRGKIDKRIFK